MVFHHTDRVTAAPVEQTGRAAHAFNEVLDQQRQQRVEKTHRRTEAAPTTDKAQETRPPGKGQRPEVKSIDCKRGCPFEGIHSAKAQINPRGDSDAFTQADARALKNFNPNNGPMSEAQMTAIQHLIKHAMDEGPDGKPLWTSYAPQDPEARSQFKDMLFGGNADYAAEKSNAVRSDISESVREQHYENIRNYGEEMPTERSFNSSSPTSLDFSGRIYPAPVSGRGSSDN